MQAGGNAIETQNQLIQDTANFSDAWVWDIKPKCLGPIQAQLSTTICDAASYYLWNPPQNFKPVLPLH